MYGPKTMEPLVAWVGRRPPLDDPLVVVEMFNTAWNAHDLDAALKLCNQDVVFESTDPAPDGRRAVGIDAVAVE